MTQVGTTLYYYKYVKYLLEYISSQQSFWAWLVFSNFKNKWLYNIYTVTKIVCVYVRFSQKNYIYYTNCTLFSLILGKPFKFEKKLSIIPL